MNRADAICPADLCDAPEFDPVYVCTECTKELWYPPTRGQCDACLAVVELIADLQPGNAAAWRAAGE